MDAQQWWSRPAEMVDADADAARRRERQSISPSALLALDDRRALDVRPRTRRALLIGAELLDLLDDVLSLRDLAEVCVLRRQDRTFVTADDVELRAGRTWRVLATLGHRDDTLGVLEVVRRRLDHVEAG